MRQQERYYRRQCWQTSRDRRWTGRRDGGGRGGGMAEARTERSKHRAEAAGDEATRATEVATRTEVATSPRDGGGRRRRGRGGTTEEDLGGPRRLRRRWSGRGRGGRARGQRWPGQWGTTTAAAGEGGGWAVAEQARGCGILAIIWLSVTSVWCRRGYNAFYPPLFIPVRNGTRDYRPFCPESHHQWG